MGDGKGQPTSPASICIFISPPCPPPHWLAVLGSPHCPQCLRLLLRSWICQIVPRTEKRWEASLTQPQAPGLPGEEAGKPKSLPDHGSVQKAGKGWVAPAPGVVNPTWLKSQDQNSPKASSLWVTLSLLFTLLQHFFVWRWNACYEKFQICRKV